MEQILKNIAVMGIVVGLLSVLIFFAGKGFDKFVNALDRGITYLVNKTNIKNWRFATLFIELLLISSSALLLLISRDVRGIWVILYTIFVILPIFKLRYYIRKLSPGQVSIFTSVRRLYNPKNYFANRLLLAINQLADIQVLLVFVVITFTFITGLSWPEWFYYTTVVVLPVYTTIWIYYPYFKANEVNRDDIVTARRITAFAASSVFIFYELYIRFQRDILQQLEGNDSYLELFKYASYVGFLALERLAKAVMDDHKDFKKRNLPQ